MYSLICTIWNSLVYSISSYLLALLHNLGLYTKTDFFLWESTHTCSRTRTHVRRHTDTHTHNLLSLFHLLHTPHLHLVQPGHSQLPSLCFSLPTGVLPPASSPTNWGSEIASRRLHCQTPPAPVEWAACCAPAERTVSGTVWSAPR